MKILWRYWISVAVVVVVVFGGLSTSTASTQRPQLAWLSTDGGGCSGVASSEPREAYGLVTFWRGENSQVQARVHIIRGDPNERYTVNHSCIGSIGDVYTNAAGNGVARLEFTPGTSFAIDVHLYCVPQEPGECSERWGVRAQTELQSLPS